MSFRSWRLATLSFLTLPMALVGGALAAFIGGGVLSLGSLVGFFTVFGIAARNGILMINHFQHLEERGGRAVRAGARPPRCARAVVADPDDHAGDRPCARAARGRRRQPGHEIEHPLAVVVLGGLVTSTLLNLFVVPALYLRFAKGKITPAHRSRATDQLVAGRGSASCGSATRNRPCRWLDEGVTKPLWAPWRLEYVQSADEEPGCVFCLALEGDDEERLVVHRGARAFVVLNKFPYSSGHLMVAPQRHLGEFGALDDDEVVEIHRLADRGMRALGELYGPDGFNLGWNLGRVAAPGSSTTSTCTSCRAGPATRTSCRCSRT